MATASKTTKKAATKKKVAAADADGAETEAPAVKAKAKPKAKTATKRRTKTAEPPRAKLYWGVFNQNSKRVAVFDFADKKEAEKHVKQLSKNGNEHFIQRIKEEIEKA